ncbi:MAG: hypothetical protein CL799_08555 [Chromatiales bacterium]|nr:hypothetical protein [Chromatiales bacterium]
MMPSSAVSKTWPATSSESMRRDSAMAVRSAFAASRLSIMSSINTIGRAEPIARFIFIPISGSRLIA